MSSLASRTFRSNRSLGIFEIVSSGVGFGALGVFGKASLAAGIKSGENLSLRFLISSVLLLLGLAAAQPRALRVTRGTVLRCAGLGIAGYAVFSSLYFAALEGLSASLTVLLLYTYPVIVTVLARVFLQQRIGRRNLVALPVVMAGLVCLVSADLAAKDPRYIAYGLGAAALYSVYILVSSRVLRGISPIASVALIQLFAGLALAAVYLRDPARVVQVVSTGWLILLGTATVCTAAPMVLFISGLQKLSSPEVSLLSTTEPVTGIAFATFWLGERLAPLQWLGAAVIIGALLHVAWPRRLAAAAGVAAAVLCLAGVAHAKPLFKVDKAYGVLADAGYETIAYKDTHPGVSLDGLGASALATFEASHGGRWLVQADGGLHFSDVSGDNDVADLSVTMVALTFEAVPSVVLREVHRVGALLGYEYGLFGRATYTSNSAGTIRSSLRQASRFSFGARYLRELDEKKAIGGDVAWLEGGYELEKARTPVDYSGLSLRFVFNYLLKEY